MSDLKQDVKEIVKVFILVFVSIVVKESTKKLIKSLTQIQRKMLEARVKNMSDDQLEQYFDKNSYFKNELENTVKSVNHINPKGSGSWLENLQQVCESSCIQNLIKVLIQQVTKITLAGVACVALLAVVAVPAVVGDLHNNTESPEDVNKPSIPPEYYGVKTTPASDPVADFSTNVTSGYTPLSVQFTYLSENVTEWNWDFGDGEHSTEQNPMYTYYTAGNYTVKLTVTNGKVTDSKTAIITVLEQPVLPFANFSSNIERYYVPLYVKFTDQSENATGWKWDFGDGTNSTEQNPAHTYSFKGNYTVNLTAINTNGTDSKIALIKVLKRSEPTPEPVLPAANFSGNVTSGYTPLSVQFTDLSEDATGRKWDFGDGATSTGQNPVHTYSAAGNYTVSQTVSNANGTDSKNVNITVLQRLIYAYVTNSDDNTVSVINASANTTYTVDVGRSPYGVAVSPDGTKIYVTNSDDNTVSVINASDNTTYTVNVGNWPTGVAVSPDGTKIYVTNSWWGKTEDTVYGTVSVINASDNTTYTVNVGNWPTGVAVSPDGTKVYVANSWDDTVSVINASDNTTYTVNVGENPEGVVVSPDGTKVYVTNYWSNNISVINILDNSTDTIPVEFLTNEFAVSPDGAKIYVTATSDEEMGISDEEMSISDEEMGINNNVFVIDTENKTVTATVPVGDGPEGVAVTPDGKEVYVVNRASGTVSVINTATYTVTATVPVGGYPVEVAIIQR